MNENDESNGNNKLKDLVNHYQEQRAPIGFAERVAVRAKEAKQDKAYSPYRLPIPLGMGATIGAALVLVVSTTVVVVNLTTETAEDIQLAQQGADGSNQAGSNVQDTGQSESTAVDAGQEPTRLADTLDVEMEQRIEPAKVKEAIELASLPSPQDAGFANVAVLSDLSDWLDESQNEMNGELDATDFYDLPDLADLDAISGIS